MIAPPPKKMRGGGNNSQYPKNPIFSLFFSFSLFYLMIWEIIANFANGIEELSSVYQLVIVGVEEFERIEQEQLVGLFGRTRQTHFQKQFFLESNK